MKVQQHVQFSVFRIFVASPTTAEPLTLASFSFQSIVCWYHGGHSLWIAVQCPLDNAFIIRMRRYT